MAIYNLTNTTDANNFAEYAVALNTISENTFGFMLYITILVILFVNLKLRTTADVGTIFVTTMFVSIILSIMLLTLGLVPQLFVVISVIGSAIGLGFTVIKNNRD